MSSSVHQSQALFESACRVFAVSLPEAKAANQDFADHLSEFIEDCTRTMLQSGKYGDRPEAQLAALAPLAIPGYREVAFCFGPEKIPALFKNAGLHGVLTTAISETLRAGLATEYRDLYEAAPDSTALAAALADHVVTTPIAEGHRPAASQAGTFEGLVEATLAQVTRDLEANCPRSVFVELAYDSRATCLTADPAFVHLDGLGRRPDLVAIIDALPDLAAQALSKDDSGLTLADYLNTPGWHGTPLDALLFDSLQGAVVAEVLARSMPSPTFQTLLNSLPRELDHMDVTLTLTGQNSLAPRPEQRQAVYAATLKDQSLAELTFMDGATTMVTITSPGSTKQGDRVRKVAHGNNALDDAYDALTEALALYQTVPRPLSARATPTREGR
jgi:hypothetical protein